MIRYSLIAVAIFSAAIGGCANNNVGVDVPRGDAAYALVPAASASRQLKEYRIGPLDKIDVTVFQEPDLTMKGLTVDASGLISIPFVDNAQAAGLTARELARSLEDELRSRYLHPQVTVTITESVSQRVTVQGEVDEPGIYPIAGATTLLGAIALASGETDVAATRDVVVLRTIDGEPKAAVFDIQRIRQAQDPDPLIEGNDVVIVGYSRSRGLKENILLAVPVLNLFALSATRF